MKRFNFSEISNDVGFYLVKVLMVGLFTTIYWIVLSEIYVFIDGFISLPKIPIPYDSETDSVIVGLFSGWLFVFCLSYSIVWDKLRKGMNKGKGEGETLRDLQDYLRRNPSPSSEPMK